MGPSFEWQPSSRGYTGVGLVRPKTGFNVGGVMRAAHAFWVNFVAISGNRIGQKYERTATDTTAASKHIPIFRGDDILAFCPQDCEPVAVDILPGSESLVGFHHNPRTFYIFGPEDGTLGKSITDHCSRVVTIPSRFCLNLAAAVNVILYDRISKLPINRIVQQEKLDA